MEHIQFDFHGSNDKVSGRSAVLIGVVSSGNLEVLVEPFALDGHCQVSVSTNATGFTEIWEAVIKDFAARHDLSNLVNMNNQSEAQRRHSYYEANARQRIAKLLDTDSFVELIGPAERRISPHLEPLGQPCAFDDGVVIGRGFLSGRPVLVASQEGGFMGGAVGEVHGAKLTGLLELAIVEKPSAVLLLLESGGVRLHEANAGLLAISEILRALMNVRDAGIPVLGLIGGAFGCFGGMGIVARCCDTLIINEEGRLGLSGPDVIETTMGVEEFDASDRALVWRTVGGKHRYLLAEVHCLVEDDIASFRDAAITNLGNSVVNSLETLEKEHRALTERLATYGQCRDGLEVWSKMGIANPDSLPLLNIDDFLRTVAARSKESYED
jgi:malonate decarboxylase beta subunit